MGARESRVENYLRRRVKEEHGQIRKVRWIGRRGAPDDFVWWPGPRAAFVECKSEDGELSKIQAREIDRLRRDGFKVFVVSTFEEVDAAVNATKGSNETWA